jgi:hypothetical protein
MGAAPLGGYLRLRIGLIREGQGHFLGSPYSRTSLHGILVEE